MGLPGHRRTSSHKRRRASHFALGAPTLTTDKKTGQVHRPHRVAPGATEYRGIAIHVKGADRKLRKMLEKTKSRTLEQHDHHDHEHHEHASAAKVKASNKAAKATKKKSSTQKKVGSA